MEPNILSATVENIAAAAKLVAAGKLVAFPTETVYGLGGNATDDKAVTAVYAAKNRPRSNPLIVHFANAQAVMGEVVFDSRAERLARAFWPGALTLVLPRREGCAVSTLAGAGGTLAVRVPGDDVALALLRQLPCPLTAPSANRSGDASPTTAAQVAASLGGAVDAILDGGPCRVGIESTIVDLTGEGLVVLRAGAVTADEINQVLEGMEYDNHQG